MQSAVGGRTGRRFLFLLQIKYAETRFTKKKSKLIKKVFFSLDTKQLAYKKYDPCPKRFYLQKSEIA